MNKKGIKRKTILWIIFLILLVVLFFYYKNVHDSCTITAEELNSSSMNLWLKQNIFQCKKENGIFSTTIDWTKDILGFNEGFYEFLSDLLKGALVGFWFWIVFVIAGWERRLKKYSIFNHLVGSQYKIDTARRLKNSWLGFIGGSLWKIIPIAVGYAVLMQIPLVNSFIKIITFETLFGFSTNVGWGWFLTSFIIAFYIGFLPTAIQAYTEYKIKKKYEDAIIRESYRGKIVDAMAQNG